jgi:hypothetical protein
VVWYLKNEIISLSFRRIKEESSDGSGSVNHVDFYVISYVLGVCGFASGREGSYRKLDTACAVACTVDPGPYTPYEHTNSYRISFENTICIFNSSWISFENTFCIFNSSCTSV